MKTIQVNNLEISNIRLAKFSLTNSELFVTADNSDNIHLWRNEQQSVQFGSVDQISCLEFDQNDKSINCGNKKGLISVLDIESEKGNQNNQLVIDTIQAHISQIKVIKNYNQGMIVSGSADKKITLIDLRQKQKIAELLGHHLQINDLQLSEQIISSSSNDGTVKIWDLRKMTTLKTFSEHQSPVTVLSLLQNQQILVSGEEDNMMIGWDLKKLEQYSKDSVQCSVQKLTCDQQQSVFFSFSTDFIAAWNTKLEMLEQFSQKMNQVLDVKIDESITILSQPYMNNISKIRIEFPHYLGQYNEQDQQSKTLQHNLSPKNDSNQLYQRPQTAPNLTDDDDLFTTKTFTSGNQSYSSKKLNTNLEVIKQEEDQEEDIIATNDFSLSMQFKQENNTNLIKNNEELKIQGQQQGVPNNPFSYATVTGNSTQIKQENEMGDDQDNANEFSKCFYPAIKITELEECQEQDLDIISTQQFSFSQILFTQSNKEYYKQIELIDEINNNHLRFMAILTEKQNVMELIVNSWIERNYQKAVSVILEQTNLAILADAFNLISDRLKFNKIKEDYFSSLLEKAESLLESQYIDLQVQGIQFIQLIFNAVSEKILSLRKQQLKRPKTSPQQGLTSNDKIILELRKIDSKCKTLIGDNQAAKQLHSLLSVFLNKI